MLIHFLTFDTKNKQKGSRHLWTIFLIIIGETQEGDFRIYK